MQLEEDSPTMVVTAVFPVVRLSLPDSLTALSRRDWDRYFLEYPYTCRSSNHRSRTRIVA
jgi:hypothetical protein